MAARAPLDRIAGVLEPAAAAHHRLGVGHQEGDVVERVLVGIGERDRVVGRCLAAQERHDARAVAELEAERALEECLGAGDVSGV